MKGRHPGLALLLAAAFLLLSCAAKRSTAPDPLLTSDAELRAGCYRCLEAALTSVEGRTGAAARAFDALPKKLRERR